MRSLGRRSDPPIDVLIGSARWKRQPQAAATVRKAVAAAAKAASTPRAELAIVLTNDSAIRALNRIWRGNDAPTNVLSFPAARYAAAAHPRASGDPGSRTTNAAPGSRLRRNERKRARILRHLGDIVIAFETVRREAAAEGKPFLHHLAHLAVHGYLHLLGHDHDTARDALRMERLETAILAQLGIPDPYAARASAR
jgi:probable rRNA maturation factor